MTLLQAAILGIIEGITEFLPISSTGHLIVAEKFMGIASTDTVKSFDIVIQLGAIAAALVVYWNVLMKNRHLWKTTLAAFIPTAILGFLLHGSVKTYLLGNVAVVAWALGIGGILLLGFEYVWKSKEPETKDVHGITVKQAIIIGLVQTLAVIPGTSRSAATIIGGMMLGISRAAIVDFSFLLAIPTMAGATVLDIAKSYGQLSFEHLGIFVVGFLLSFVTAYAVIRWLLRFIRTHTFIVFGVYRIGLAVVVFALLS